MFRVKGRVPTYSPYIFLIAVRISSVVSDLIVCGSVGDPDPGSGIRCLFDSCIRDPGCVNNQDPDPGSGMNISDHISESLETVFWVKNT
jgi:hypothetical protein